MDCRGDELIQHNNRASAQAVPFQYLINEQAKSILALQELQNEVGALLEFRDLVMDTFPHLRQKQVSSPEPSSGSQGVGSGENRWEPGVRVRRKLGSSSGWMAGGGGGGLAAAATSATAPRSRSNSHGKGPKSGEPATTSVGTVQDSGFCTESKDSSSTGSRTMTKNCCKDEDELWSLLEVIQDKGTKLKLEVEFLQNRLLQDDEQLQRRRWQRLRRCRSLDDVQLLYDGKRLSPGVADDYCSDYNVFRAHVTDLKRERDALLDRVTEMEAESLSNAAQIHRLLAELRSVVCENRELEERLTCGGGKPSASAITCGTMQRKCSSHNGGGFAPVQHDESSTGPSSSSAGRDAYYTPSQHSACNLSSIELCKQCSSSYTETDDDRQRSRMLLVRPSDPISRNLEGRVASPPPPPAMDIGSPTFAKRLGALDGIVSSPADRIGKPATPGWSGVPLPKRTLAAILKTFNPIELQRHLITVSYENKNLVWQMDTLNKSKTDVSAELNKSKEDNEELKFQLEEKRIELEGTMARVRLLQLHQEQQQHGPVCGGAGQSSNSNKTAAAATTTTTTNQWLDLVPSNPILPQIALPATPSSSSSTTAAAATTSSHHQHLNHHHHNNNHQQQQLQHQDENGGGGSSSTESAHQARSSSGGRGHHQSQPSKIPVVKSSYSVLRPPSSYREHMHHTPRDPYPSWNKCKSDQSLPRNWEPINNKSGGGSSIGSGGGGGRLQRGANSSSRQDSLQDSCHHVVKQHHHRSRRDSGSGGGTSLTRAKSQNHHQRAAATAAAAAHATAKERTTGTAMAASQSSAADDTNKAGAPAVVTNNKKLFRRRNLVRHQTRCLMDGKKTALPAVDEVQEPPDSLATAAARLLQDNGGGEPAPRYGGHDDDEDDDDDDEFFFDSIESSLATSQASSRRPPPECDSIDLSQPDASLT